MIETHMQQQEDAISQQSSHSHPYLEAQTGAETGSTITCRICNAVYAPSSQQAPFLQYAQETLEATFMGICHFCFRCRRAACPQCWDEVHGVCGSCVQEAGLRFRMEATPLDGLMFPPTERASSSPPQTQASSLFVTVRNGHFYHETQARPEPIFSDITTEHTLAVKAAASQPGAPDSQVADGLQDDTGIAANLVVTKPDEKSAAGEDQTDTPAAITTPTKTPAPEDAQETRAQEQTSRVAKAQKAKKVSRLEKLLTWIVLVIVVALVVVIALAEFIPAVNTAIAQVTHIDIHGEIAYLVHIVQQLFKR